MGTYSVRVTPYLGKFRGETSDLVEFEVFHPNAPEAPVAPKLISLNACDKGRIPNSAEEKKEALFGIILAKSLATKLKLPKMKL